MKLELRINQGEGLDIVLDKAMSGGICFAITVQWAFLLLKGAPYETEVINCQTFKRKKGDGGFQKMTEGTTNVCVQSGFFTLVSLQRGYDTVDMKLADKMDSAQQDTFFEVASRFSENYLRSLCRTEGRQLKPMEVFKKADDVTNSLSFREGTAELIGIFGTEDGSNWGHIVGALRRSKHLFFDANSGQYSGEASQIKTEISAYLKSNYDGIQNCAKYTISK